jgi:protein gp37
LFHDGIDDLFIAQIFATMAVCPRHRFMILTKRHERMAKLVASEEFLEEVAMYISVLVEENCDPNQRRSDDMRATAPYVKGEEDWPLRNVWLGVSVENQETANARVPLLLSTPAHRRFVSYEPALGPVDWKRVGGPGEANHPANLQDGNALFIGDVGGIDFCWTPRKMVHQIIVGGESGPGARRFNVKWARDTIQQCLEGQVACFVKQLGTDPIFDADEAQLVLRDKKGGWISEWPSDIRVREWPA